MSDTEPRRIVIGDVHGHYEGLMRLLAAIAPAADDQLYFLGDLIDRGPASAKVVEFVKDGGHHCLLGNHEQLMIDSFPNSTIYAPALQAWLYSGGRATVASYGEEGIPVPHLDWMKTLPRYMDLGDVWLVHAGVNPRLPLSRQSMQEFCWIRDEFHSIEKPYFPNKLIITGHTITFTLPEVSPGELASGPGWLDIDTGAYHPKSGWLTGVDLKYRKVYQVNVFRREMNRCLPLDEATRSINPARIIAHRQALST